jgi:hypothetical protein
MWLFGGLAWRGFSFSEGSLCQLPIKTTSAVELRMVATLDDLTLVHYQYLIAATDGRQPVGDDDNSAVSQ